MGEFCMDVDKAAKRFRAALGDRAVYPHWIMFTSYVCGSVYG